jgi:hypothetical protein
MVLQWEKAVTEATILYLHCNAPEYYSAGARACPHDGYQNPRADYVLRVWGGLKDTTYAKLLSAGLSEEDLLELLIVPRPQATKEVLALREMDAAEARAFLAIIGERNRLILELFPNGALATELAAEPSEEYLPYVRSHTHHDKWLLVGNANHDPKILAHNGITPEAFDRCVKGDYGHEDVRMFRVSKGHPPRLLDANLPVVPARDASRPKNIPLRHI